MRPSPPLLGKASNSAINQRTTRTRCSTSSPSTSSSSSSSSKARRMQPTPASVSSAARGMQVAELSVTADLLKHSQSTEEAVAAAVSVAAGLTDEPDSALSKQPWVRQLVAANPGCKLVFNAHGNPAETRHSLSTGLSGDHLFLSLLQNDLLQDMLVLYTQERKLHTILRLGLPVCGHPSIVHGGLTSAVFDESFGIALYAAGRWGHLPGLTMVFTARLEVDYKKPVPAEATIVCVAEVESMEGRKIWLTARLTDPSGEVVYAASRALFVKPRDDGANGSSSSSAAAAGAPPGPGAAAGAGAAAE